jgi:dimethylpropiothetin dethiomethylase
MEHSEAKRATTELIEAVRTTFETELAKETPTAPLLERVLTKLPDLRLDPEAKAPAKQPVCRHLSRALDLGEAGPAAPVARAIRQLEPTLHWRQNPKYTVENRGADFMENYAFTDFGLIGSDTLYIGAVLLGPGVTYEPTTYSGSEGVFLVIGGSPEWKCGDDPWRRFEAGSIISRPLDGAEGKRPGNEPMLALYAWLYP